MHDTHSGPLHWESWLLRLLLVAVGAFEVIAQGNREGATVAAEGLLVTLVPLLIQRFGHVHVPRPLEFVYVLGMTLQFVSEGTKLFEVFYYWDKIVHPGLVALTALMAGWLLLGYRDVYACRLPTHLLALLGFLTGATIGAFWEFIEFSSDWFGNADLQKSNADTMTDMMANDIGAFVAILIGFRLYLHVFSANQREETGEVAHWLTSGLGKLLDRFGRPLGAVLALAVAAAIGAGVWIDRNPPALASGLAPGGSQSWTLASMSDVQSLAGDWVPDSRGTCRVNLEHPRPGSEKMGLLELGPGTIYGQDQAAFSVTAHYFEERPPKTEGSQMDAGIAFGIRDAQNFYLLEESALHDILRLDRYVHGKRRDVRETLVRTHGNEWHTLELTVQGNRVTAGLDGHAYYDVSGVADTTGGVGVWGRTAAATCFDTAQVLVGPAVTAGSVPGPGGGL
jgi:hypothetical protein